MLGEQKEDALAAKKLSLHAECDLPAQLGQNVLE